MLEPATPPAPSSTGSFVRSLAAGTVIDRYVIECELGRGGMGVVYRARHTSLDKPVAIKFISVAGVANANAIARLKKEGETLARLRHPNILPVIDCGEVDEVPYLVLDYIDGGTVEEKLKRDGGRIAPEEVGAIIKGVLSGVKSAHEAGMIHRDIKPANLLLESDGTVRISDFGLAQAFFAGSEASFSKTVVGAPPAETVVGLAATMTSFQPARSTGASGATFGGTVLFMAPELHTSPLGDARSDIYAVGVTAYYLLTGAKPGGKFKPASKLVAGLPSSWDTFIGKCLEQDPADRFQTADSALLALEAIRSPNGRRFRYAATMVAVSVFVAALAFGTFRLFWTQSGSSGNSPIPSPPRLVVKELPANAVLRIDSIPFRPGADGIIALPLSSGSHALELRIGNTKVMEREVQLRDSGDTVLRLDENAQNLMPLSGPSEASNENIPVPTSAPNPPAGRPTSAASVEPLRVELTGTEGDLPSDTEISAGGRVLGRKSDGPLMIELPADVRSVHVKGPGLQSLDVVLTPLADKRYAVPIVWLEHQIAFTRLPPGSRVLLDGTPLALGADGTANCRLRHGRHRLVASAPWHDQLETTLDIDADTVVTPKLKWASVITVPLPGKQSLIARAIDPGKYAVGAAATERGRQASDLERTTVEVPELFYIGETEVTQGQYSSVTSAGRNAGGAIEINPSRSRAKRDPNLPVEQVSYKDLTGKLGFIDLLNEELRRKQIPLVADLPDENEWEVACRAGSVTSFNNGHDLMRTGSDPQLDEIAHYNRGMTLREPLPVRSKKPNSFGLYDMEGNVAEIVRQAAVATTKSEDVRVFARGGSWNTSAEHTRSASRVEIYRDRKSAEMGFRIVLRLAPIP